MRRVGFVGLGVMGGPMAGHLVSAGHDVAVWNRTPGKAEAIKGASVAGSLGELVAGRDFVCTCVNRTEDVEECLAGMVGSAMPGTTFIDHSTVSPEGARRMHADLADRGLRFIDAPVTGGSMGAKSGTLTIFCGGSDGDIEDATPVMSAYGKTVEHVGGPGAGQTTKMANQIAVGGSLLALCESLSFAKKAGLDVAKTRELISRGAAGSWAMDNYGPKIEALDWSPGFSVKNQRKDFGYCAEAAESVGAAVPGTLLVDRLLGKLEERGDGELASAALYDVLMEMGYGE